MQSPTKTDEIYTLIFKATDQSESVTVLKVKYDILKCIPRLIKSLDFGGIETKSKRFIIVQPYLTKEIVMTYMNCIKWRRDNLKNANNFQHFLTWNQRFFRNTPINITTHIQSFCFNSGDPSSFACNPYVAALAQHLDDELFFQTPFYGAILSFEKSHPEITYPAWNNEVGKIYIPFCFKNTQEITEYICHQLVLMGEPCHVVDDYDTKYQELLKTIKEKENQKERFFKPTTYNSPFVSRVNSNTRLLGFEDEVYDMYNEMMAIGNNYKNKSLKKVIKELKNLRSSLENLQHNYSIVFHEGFYSATINTNSIIPRSNLLSEENKPLFSSISFIFKFNYRSYSSTKEMTESKNFIFIPEIVQAQICEDYIKYINESRGNPHRKLYYFCTDSPEIAKVTWNGEAGPLLVCKTLGMGVKARESAAKKKFDELANFANNLAKKLEGPYNYQPHEDQYLKKIDDEFQNTRKRLRELEKSQEDTWSLRFEKENIRIRIKELNQMWADRCEELLQKRNKKSPVKPDAYYKYLASGKK